MAIGSGRCASRSVYDRQFFLDNRPFETTHCRPALPGAAASTDHRMPVGAYQRPPITEAVIDIQFATPVSNPDLETLRTLLVETYPRVETRLNWNIAIGPGTVQVGHVPAGLKMSSADSVDIVVLYPSGITNSRLAPYNGWSNFRDRASRVFSQCMGKVGYRPVKRIGVRYINRLDIPSDIIRIDEWLRLAITLPPSIPSDLTTYGLHVALPLSSNVRLNLHISTVDSPVLQHGSLLLDIDVYVDYAVPSQYAEI